MSNNPISIQIHSNIHQCLQHLLQCNTFFLCNHRSRNHKYCRISSCCLNRKNHGECIYIYILLAELSIFYNLQILCYSHNLKFYFTISLFIFRITNYYFYFLLLIYQMQNTYQGIRECYNLLFPMSLQDMVFHLLKEKDCYNIGFVFEIQFHILPCNWSNYPKHSIHR